MLSTFQVVFNIYFVCGNISFIISNFFMQMVSAFYHHKQGILYACDRPIEIMVFVPSDHYLDGFYMPLFGPSGYLPLWGEMPKAEGVHFLGRRPVLWFSKCLRYTAII